MEVSHEMLAFSTLNVGQDETRWLLIESVGEDTLHIEEIVVDGPAVFTIDDSGTDPTLEPGESTELAVIFTPVTDGDSFADLHVISDDVRGDQPGVVLFGGGIAPVLELDPAEIDFGDQEIGCEMEQEITIRNTGSAPLVLDEVTFTPTSDEMLFSYYFAEGTTLAPAQSETVTVYYAPIDDMTDTGYLHVYSNDPLTPDALATQIGSGTLTELLEDNHEVESTEEVDILWVIDNSAAMVDLQVQNTQAFVNIVDVVDIDYQIAVVSTDDPSFRGPIITPSTPDSVAEFAQACAVGTTGAGPNTGLQTGLDALSPPFTDPGGAHEGFLREDAGLKVIFVGASEDQSANTVTDIVSGYWALKANSDHVVLSTINDTANAARYEQAATMTGGLVEDINNANWINTLSQLFWYSPNWGDSYELTQVPVPETVEVLVNGTPVYVGWYFDEIYNAVVFELDYLPEQGDVITIRYRPEGMCA